MKNAPKIQIGIIAAVFLVALSGVALATIGTTLVYTNPDDDANSTGTIILNVTADGTTVQNVTFFLTNSSDDSVEIGTNTTAGTIFTFSFDTTTTPDGEYNFSATARNSTQTLESTDNATGITIDNTAPTISYADPTPTSNSNNSESFIEFNVTASDVTTELGTITLYIYNSTDLVESNTSSTSPFFWNKTGLSDGTYTINATVNDTVGNENTSLTSRTVTLDVTDPTISFSLDKTYVYTNEVITASCSASDGIDSSPSVSFTTTPSTSSTGTFTTTCTATDDAGNDATSSLTYEVDDKPGSSSGDSSGSTTSEKKHTFPKITPGVASILKITDEDLGLTQISIEVNNQANNVKITITKLDNQPASVTHEIDGQVYKYLEIDADNLDNSNIDNSKIRFTVPKSWLADNDADRNDITLYRYTSQWNALDTRVVSETSDEIEYEATSSGFSYFAIGSKAAEMAEDTEQEPAQEQEQTPVEETPSERSVWTAWIVLAFLLLLGAGVGVTSYLTKDKSYHFKHKKGLHLFKKKK